MRPHLGSGISFPIKFDAGRIKTADDIHSVVSAIWMLFGTRKGTRFMLPEYGSDLFYLLFEPCSEVTAQMAAIYAYQDIITWIPRVEYVNVTYDIDNDNAAINLRIMFRLRNHPNEVMMIYPFYLESSEFIDRPNREEVTYTII